jgi:dolichyl-phosphate beta-glucosyltransferase
MPYLSLILPCYNTSAVLAKQLPSLLSFLNSKNFSYELIIVDDGSADGKDLSSIAEINGCTYIKNEKNMGKGASVRKGMQYAQGQFLLFTDGDIPFEYEAITTILWYLDAKEFDLAVGDRTLKDSSYFGEIPLARKISSSLFTFFVGRFVTTGMNDTQCGLKGFRKDAAKDIFSLSRINGFAFDVEAIYIAMKRNYDIKRIPVKLRSQEGTSVSLWRHTIPMVLDLFLIKWNHIWGLYNKIYKTLPLY